MDEIDSLSKEVNSGQTIRLTVDEAADWLKARFGKNIVPGLKARFNDQKLTQKEFKIVALEEHERLHPGHRESVIKSLSTPFGYF